MTQVGKDFSLEDVRIYDGQGKLCSFDEVLSTLKYKLPTDKIGKVHVGTDAHVHGKKVEFVTVICLWGDGRGGHFYKFRSSAPRERLAVMHQKLLAEVQMSLDTANKIMEADKWFDYTKFVIHIDVNLPLSGHPSGKSAESLRSYARAFGFDCVIKQQSWAASGVADHFAR